MTVFDDLAQRYTDVWNEIDPTARRAAVEALFSPNAHYTDPMVAVEGREAIAATVGEVQDQFPGCTFRLTGPADGHHQQVRFGWELGPVGEADLIVGFDVAVLDTEGRIQTVHGFLDKVPSAA